MRATETCALAAAPARTWFRSELGVGVSNM